MAVEQPARNSKKSTLQILALILSIAAVGTAVYYSASWYEELGQDVLPAWILACVYIGFVTLIFEVGVAFLVRAKEGAHFQNGVFQKGGKTLIFWRRVGGALCIFVAILLELLNVLGTAGAQYTMLVTHKTETPAIVIDTQTAKDTVVDLEAAKKRIEDELKELDNKKAIIETNYKRLRVAYWAENPKGNEAHLQSQSFFLTYWSALTEDEGKRKDIRQRLDEKDTEIRKAREEKSTVNAVKSKTDAYSEDSVFEFFNLFIKTENPKIIQFWLLILPSLFLGAIACIGFALFLYADKMLRSKKGN